LIWAAVAAEFRSAQSAPAAIFRRERFTLKEQMKVPNTSSGVAMKLFPSFRVLSAFLAGVLLFSLALAAQAPAPGQQPAKKPAQAAPAAKAPAPAQPQTPLPPGTAGIHGQVMDQTGAVIPGATVAIMSADVSKDMNCNDYGQYSFRGIPPGSYTLSAFATGFANLQVSSIQVVAGQDKAQDLNLVIAARVEEVKVEETNMAQLSVDSASNVGAIVMKGQDLEALPDDPDDLQADLQALAGPTAGPNGGQIYVDGFTGGRMPPKESIREIRINSNPFSAEYDRLGFGRIEILTKPGYDKLRGSVSFIFGDNIWNARNPYSLVKPSADHKQYSGNLGGPIGSNHKASFFLDYERRDTFEGTLINGFVLNSALQQTPYNQSYPTPSHRFTVGPRLDYQINGSNTLTFRYSFTNYAQDNLGVSGFSLPTQAYYQISKEQTANIVETWIVNPKIVNETRVQVDSTRLGDFGGTGAPTIQVNSAFQTGGAGEGYNFANTINNEFSNFTSITSGKHFLKFGARIRTNNDISFQQANYNGQYIFTSITSYQATLAGLALFPSANGVLNPAITAPCTSSSPVYMSIPVCGGGPSQFYIYSGQNLAGASQFDVGAFVQDDWRLRQNLSVNLGMRLESQDNIHDHADFAPRVAFAWGIGGTNSRSRTPKTVIRGGFGMFYDRLPVADTLLAERQNGINQLVYTLQNPAFFSTTAIPPLTGAVTGSTSTIRQISSLLHAPYIMQSVLTVERQLPRNTTLSVQYMSSRGVHELRSRNINAPLPGTYVPATPTTAATGVYPFFSTYGQGPVELFESSGLFRQNQIVTSVNTRFNSMVSIFGYYAYGVANSNTDGANTFPSNQYDESTEWGRAAFNVRNRGLISGTITAKWAIHFAPFITMASGTPFNITDGLAFNGDSIINARPSFATSADPAADVRVTPWGTFNIAPLPGETIIPRNYGVGPGNFSVNLRVSRTWGFGEKNNGPAPGDDPAAAQRRAQMAAGGGPGRGGPGGGGPGGGGGGGGRGGGAPRGGGGAGDSAPGRYNLTLSANARNLFNHVNPGAPISNLASPEFGQSTFLGGGGFGGGQTANRRIDLSLRFTF
jgi:hypothetical protein